MSDNNRITDVNEMAQKIVREDVRYCVSLLISDLNKLVSNADASVLKDISFDQEELMAICVQDDWQSPAEYQDYELFENDGEYVALQPKEDVIDNMTLDNLAYIEHAGKFYVIPEDLFEKIQETPANIGEIIEKAKQGEDGTFFEGDTQHAVLEAYLCEHYADDWYDDEQTAWREACEANHINPDQNEAYEHWAVSDWLARHLKDHGEMVSDDISGMTIWGRCTTGQVIYMDGVIQEIAKEILKQE